MPSRASANSASVAHSDEANVSLTPCLPEHETELNSSRRSGRWCACAVLTAPASSSVRVSVSPCQSRLAMDGNWGDHHGVKHRASGYLCSVTIPSRGTWLTNLGNFGIHFSDQLVGPALETHGIAFASREASTMYFA